MEYRFRVTVPQLGIIDIEDIPQGAVVNWGNMVYTDGHSEGVLTMHDGISYFIETLVS